MLPPSDKLGELEREKVRLTEQVQTQQRQVLEIEIEKLKRQQLSQITPVIVC